MGSDITLSKAVRGNLLSLQSTSDLLTKTQERLSTGLKVNSALDNPTNFFTASSLNSRASDLGRLLDSVGNATQTLEAADNGISAITDLVEAAQATARQALQTSAGVTGGTFTAATTTGTGAALSADAGATVTGTGAALSADAPATVTGTGATLNADVDGVTTGSADISALSATGGNLDINGTSITIAASANASAILTAINDETTNTGVTATLDGSNQLVLTGSDGQAVDVDNTSDATTLTELGLTGGSTDTTTSTVSLLTQGFSSGETLTLDVGGSTSTITFGTGTGEVATLDDLNTELGSFATANANVTSAGIDASGNLSVVGANNEDSITIGGTSDSALLGSADGTTEATNLLSQGFASGETLTLDVGGSTASITFGTGTSEVSTLDELNTALGSFATANANVTSASVDASGNLSVVSAGADDSITVGGTSDSGLLGSADGTTDGTNLLSQGFSQGETLTFTVGSNAAETITFGTGTNEVSTIDELNTALGALTNVTASVDASGNLTATGNSGTNGDSLTIGGTSDSGLLGSADGTTEAVVLSEGTNRREDLETDFNELLSQIDQLKNDAGFNGKNLLDGDDLKVIFNEDGSSSLTIGGVDFDSAGLGLSEVSSGDFATDANIEATLGTLDTATNTLRSQASKFGSNLSVVETRQNFTKETINTLETGAANLTLADLNEEGANLLSLQTRQSLSST
ncbi:MAG: hypothetical protein ABJ349_11015, partial [Hyphomicrobiales bacterium]